MKDKKAIGIFLLITIVLSCICYYVIISGKGSSDAYISLLMWCPAIGAFIVNFMYYRDGSVLGFNVGSLKYYIIAFLLPLVYLVVSYGIYWFINKESLVRMFPITSIGMFISMFIGSFVTAAGEEIGWRGFLLPRLTKVYSFWYGIIITGVVWALWHYPLLIAGLYKPGTPLWYQLSLFTIEILIISSILGILRLKSNSVWPAAIFHASHNMFDQSIFEPITFAEKSPYYVGETGFITAIAMALVLVGLYWITHKRVEQQ